MIRGTLTVALCLVLALSAACTTTSGGGKSATDADASGSYQQPYEETNFYYEFDDVLIPRQLTFESDDSYSFDTDGFKMGVLVFKGRVNNQDLIDFFINNMSKDNWTLKTSLKASKSVLIFEKPNKSCVIQVADGFQSTVTILAVEHKDAALQP